MSTRDREEVELDVRYAIRLNELHRRLYRRAQFILSFIGVAASSAAVTAAISRSPTAVLLTGLVAALTGFAGAMINWGAMAERRSGYCRKYRAILNGNLPTAELDCAYHSVDVEDDDIESLRIVAYHDNARANGKNHWIVEETWLQRFWRVLA